MGRRKGDTERKTHIYRYSQKERKTKTERERDREREGARVRQGRVSKMDMGKGRASAGLRDHQRSVLCPSRGSREAFAKHWVSPEDHSEEFIPL